ncbi:sensor histidine kinase [Sulfurimonas sp.]
MNELEKKSFYSFVALYLLSSLLAILFLGYWYYSAQKNALENETYYKLNHIADRLSGRIINAQMKHVTLHLPNEKGFEYSLIATSEAQGYKSGYFEKNGYKILVSDAPQEHLNIEYVLVKTKSYFSQLHTLQIRVLSVMGMSFVLIGIIAIFLSKLFLRPLHNRMEHIENFIQDVSHELNTPITALGMSASRALKKGVFDKKILQNISISTKQLKSIYASLTYLNFKEKEQERENVALKPLLEDVILYYKELTDAKKISVEASLEEVTVMAVESRVKLLFSNLLSNAIKYSMPETKIRITLTQDSFVIKDEGVGIDEKKLKEIFELYSRSSDIAGGFGVGLSIVKRICEEFQWGVQVESKLNRGSIFTITFKK